MMKIVVLMKQVPDTNEIKINPVTGTLIRDGVPAIMNPDDKGALELALQFKDKFGAEITVLTMGLPQADAILREAFAMGADKAILLTDRKLGGADTLATSRSLAGAIRTLDYDVIFGGRQAIDGDTAQVGPQIAEHLDIPQISYVAGLDWDGKKFTVKKETEDGYQILEVEGKCLFTVLASAVKARYMNVRGIVEAYDKEVTIMNASMIDVDESLLGLKGSPTHVLKSFTKGIKQAGETFELSAEESADLIIAKLKEKHII